MTCSEYTPELQMSSLGIDLSNMVEPVLDIGCGEHGYLVKYLRKKGLEAQGFDRFAHQDDFLIVSDWLEFDYGKNKWGTIISHLGFTNHFNYQDNMVEPVYSNKYFEILKALKVGGSFHYTPNIPFIEQRLDQSLYKLTYKAVEGFDFSAVRVKKVGN